MLGFTTIKIVKRGKIQARLTLQCYECFFCLIFLSDHLCLAVVKLGEVYQQSFRSYHRS